MCGYMEHGVKAVSVYHYAIRITYIYIYRTATRQTWSERVHERYAALTRSACVRLHRLSVRNHDRRDMKR
jgi:hypothetical protein